MKTAKNLERLGTESAFKILDEAKKLLIRAFSEIIIENLPSIFKREAEGLVQTYYESH